MRISQEVKGIIMRNLCGTIFYIKANVLQNFHICMSVLLISNLGVFQPWKLLAIERFSVLKVTGQFEVRWML